MKMILTSIAAGSLLAGLQSRRPRPADISSPISARCRVESSARHVFDNRDGLRDSWHYPTVHSTQCSGKGERSKTSWRLDSEH